MTSNSTPPDPITQLQEGAVQLHEFFITLQVTGGFTIQQALYLTGQVIQASIRRDSEQ